MMALIADNSGDRAEQLILLTERLAALITDETKCIAAREPPLSGALAEEKSRLANAYRLELARIKQDRALLADAPPHLLAQLKARTAHLQDALAEHEIALEAVKLIAEGLVQAMAEETARQRGGSRGYSPTGDLAAQSGPTPVALDRTA
jgi:hypothetical protein